MPLTIELYEGDEEFDGEPWGPDPKEVLEWEAGLSDQDPYLPRGDSTNASIGGPERLSDDSKKTIE
ncbi:MAG: hypothetical protein AAF483_25630 [Planctomycetota bacterium]